MVMDHMGFQSVPTLAEIEGEEVPLGWEGARKWLRQFPSLTADGVVIRDPYRDTICKLKFSAYTEKEKGA